MLELFFACTESSWRTRSVTLSPTAAVPGDPPDLATPDGRYKFIIFFRDKASYVDATRSPTAEAQDATRLLSVEPGVEEAGAPAEGWRRDQAESLPVQYSVDSLRDLLSDGQDAATSL